jgi:3,4-dihydroxy 2-butanone 4-phosphate synthase / GTP cyclohydrolase II
VLAQDELREDQATLVRIHSRCLTGNAFGSLKCECGRQRRAVIEMIELENDPW